MSGRTYPLRTFVGRVLALRLAAAACAIAVLLGGAAWYRGYDRVGEGAVRGARDGVERLRAGVRERLGSSAPDLGSAVRQALDALPVSSDPWRPGAFVHVRVVDAGGAVVAERTEPTGGQGARLPATVAGPVRGASHEVRRIAGRPYVLVVVPLEDRHGVPLGSAEGLFRVADDTVVRVRRDALRAAAGVAGVVIATTLLLFPVILRLTRRLARHSELLVKANLETLAVLGAAVAKRDSDTDAHNWRVTLYSLCLGEATGLDAGSMRALAKGAFLHDVGKIGVRDAVLLKPGRLDDDERREMQHHVGHGVDIVRRSAWLGDARAVVAGHHEKVDGTGYPSGASGDAIPVEARVFAIADVFDALVSRRPYKEPLPLAEALRVLREGRGAHFDAALLDRFAAIAPALHAAYAGRDDEALREEVRAAVGRHFAGGLDTLRY